MRKIEFIVIHCTATPQSASVESIKRYWRNNLGWKNPGYHLIVKPDGSYVRLAPDETVCNGVKNWNSKSIHISYIGGVDSKMKAKDTRTEAQKKTLLTLVRTMKSRYPNAKVQGHRDFPRVAKDCPSFDAIKEYKEI